jgi:hypothetical protein
MSFQSHLEKVDCIVVIVRDVVDLPKYLDVLPDKPVLVFLNRSKTDQHVTSIDAADLDLALHHVSRFSAARLVESLDAEKIPILLQWLVEVVDPSSTLLVLR